MVHIGVRIYYGPTGGDPLVIQPREVTTLLVRCTLLLLVTSCAGSAPAGQPTEDGAHAFTPAEEGVLYGLGAMLGEQLQSYRLDEAEAQEVARGLVDGVLGDPEAEAASKALGTNFPLFEKKRLREAGVVEEEAGRPFLEAAAREPGAVLYESGLIMTVLEEGVGESPDTFDWVVVSYTGMLRDGTIVSSAPPENPARLRLGQTLSCWQEALGISAPGARLHLVCPPSLAYKYVGSGTNVPAGAVMIYDLHLIETNPGEDPSK